MTVHGYVPTATLGRLLWQPLLWALPIAVFFGALYDLGVSGYIYAYLVSLVFAYAIGLIWWGVTSALGQRMLGAQDLSLGAYFVRLAILLLPSVVVSVLVAGFVVDATLLPGLLSETRNILAMVLVVGVFFLLFLGIDAMLAYHRSAIERTKEEQEASLARRLHRTFLQSTFPERPRLDIYAENVPSRTISCDVYDVIALGDSRLLIAVADVAGKGVSAALLSSMLQSALREKTLTTSGPADLASNLNMTLCLRTAGYQYATAFLAVVEEDTLRLRYCNAGHYAPLLLRDGQQSLSLDCGGALLGFQDSTVYKEDVVALAPGDRLFLHTDGLVDATNPQGEVFGPERLNNLIGTFPTSATSKDIVGKTISHVREFSKGEEARDDLTVMVIRVR